MIIIASTHSMGFVQLKLSKMHQTGSIQLALSILLKGSFSFSNDSFLLLNTLIFFSLLLVQFFYVNSKLDSSQ